MLGHYEMATPVVYAVFFVLAVHVSDALPTPPKSLYEPFVQCLRNQSNSPPDQVSAIVYAPSNASYTSVLENYIRNARFNRSTSPKPQMIVTPLNESHVQSSVICAKTVGIQMKIRSGGHDYEGLSYTSDQPFLILDMFNLRKITVDIATQTAVVHVGATLGEFYHSIWEKSKVHGFPAGVCPTVGVGGHLGGGGYGNMIRKYGLTVDHIVDAQIVDVKGRLLNRKSMGEDLFWAIRGGGASSFGVMISFTVNLVPVPATVTVFRAAKTLEENATDMVYQYQQVAPTTDDRLFMRLLLQTGQSAVNPGKLTVTATVMAEFLGGAKEALALLSKEFPLLGLKQEDCKEMSWIESVLWWHGETNPMKQEILLNRNLNKASLVKRKSDYVKTPISKESLNWIFKKMTELGNIGLVFNPYGGKMSQIPASETPFPHRAGNLFKLQYSMNWQDEGPEADKNFLNQARRLYSYMTPFVSKNPRSAFMNYRDLDIGVNHHDAKSYEEGKVYGTMYFNANFERLVKVKTAVDPENFFRNEQSIPVLPK